MQDLDSDTTYKAFKAHWHKNLELIHLLSDSPTPKARANKAEEVSTIVQEAVECALAVQVKFQ